MQMNIVTAHKSNLSKSWHLRKRWGWDEDEDAEGEGEKESVLRSTSSVQVYLQLSFIQLPIVTQVKCKASQILFKLSNWIHLSLLSVNCICCVQSSVHWKFLRLNFSLRSFFLSLLRACPSGFQVERVKRSKSETVEKKSDESSTGNKRIDRKRQGNVQATRANHIGWSEKRRKKRKIE